MLQVRKEASVAARQKPEAVKKGRPRKKKHPVLRWIFRIFLSLFLLVMIAGAVLYVKFVKPEYDRLKVVAYDKLSGMNLNDMTRRSDTVVYDTNGNELGIVNAGHYVYVTIDRISENLQNAYIAQEDRHFQSHHGVDWKASLRAGIQLLLHKGRITQGGSTITQQVVKNTMLTNERSFQRKFAEIMIARELEKRYNKADIMALYCNTNFYGNNCYGIEAASQYYFDKPASELSVPEAALLAGVSNAPSRYEPINHGDAALEKRNRVLSSMRTTGYITEEEYQQYISLPIELKQGQARNTDEDYLTSYALASATITLMDVNGFAFRYTFNDAEDQKSYQNQYDDAYQQYNQQIRSGGYKIYTTLDPEIQAKVQQVLDNDLKKFKEVSENGKFALQGAAAVVDNRSGYVVATVGGRGTEDVFNRAYLSYRQPGSSIKPLLDYAPGLESGIYHAQSLIDDQPIENGPKNSGGGYRGTVTFREALNRSINTVAWQILDNVSIAYGLSFLDKLQMNGISWQDNYAKSISIGGFTRGMRVVDMAEGYAALANEGVFSGKSCIKQIVDEKSGDLTEKYTPDSAQVYHSDTAFIMTDILKGTIQKPYGTGHGLALKNGMIAAGKTGTANQSKDTWFCGYTRYYTMAVWVGYDQPRPMPGVYGATYAGKIWRDAMNLLHEGLEPWDWEPPETVVKEKDEATGTVDYISTQAGERKKSSEKKLKAEKNLEEAKKLIAQYETQEISSVKDVFTERDTYKALQELLPDLIDESFKKELEKRIQKRKAYFDSIENGMQDEILAYEKAQEESSRAAAERDAAAASEAEKQMRQDRLLGDLNAAIAELNALNERDEDTEALISSALEIYKECLKDPEIPVNSDAVQKAISRAQKLPKSGDASKGPGGMIRQKPNGDPEPGNQPVPTYENSDGGPGTMIKGGPGAN